VCVRERGRVEDGGRESVRVMRVNEKVSVEASWWMSERKMMNDGKRKGTRMNA
jgi:hypothetical protein